MNRLISAIYPLDTSPPGSAEDFCREWMKKNDTKIPPVHRSDREFMIDLFRHDVKIRKKMNEFIAETPVKEKLLNLFF